MQKLKAAAVFTAGALLLCSCNNNSIPSESTDVTTTTNSSSASVAVTVTQSDTASETPSDTASDSAPVTVTVPTETTPAPPASDSSPTSTEPPVTLPTDSWVELTPDSDSPDTLTISIQASGVAKLKYTPEQKVSSILYSDNAISISSAAQKSKLTDALNGLVFVSVSGEQKKTEKAAFDAWQTANPDLKIVPETLTFLDRNGSELISFTSDIYISLASGEQTVSFSRAFVNGKEYAFFYGDLDRTSLNNILLSQLLINNNYLSLEILGQFALNKVSAYSAEFASLTPAYRVYSPEVSLVGDDGTVIYPSSFPEGTLLVDCIFTWTNGSKTTVTLNAANGTVYQTKTVNA